MKSIRFGWLVSLTLLIAVFVVLGCSDDDNDVTDPDNQAPIISSVSADPDTFVAYQDASRITVTASDPDGDELSYEWEIHSLSFTASFASGNILEVVNCCTIEEVTSCFVLAVVSDDRGGTARDSVQIWVKPGE